MNKLIILVVIGLILSMGCLNHPMQGVVLEKYSEIRYTSGFYANVIYYFIIQDDNGNRGSTRVDSTTYYTTNVGDRVDMKVSIGV